MTTDSLQHVDAFWTTYFRCAIEDLNRPGIGVVPHAALGDYAGAFLFRRGPSCIVSLPAGLVPALLPGLEARGSDEVFQAGFLESLFGDAVERIIGPAWLGYADAAAFRPAGTHPARLLGRQDDAALGRLRDSCEATEWDHSGLEVGRDPVFGCFAGEEVVAAAGYEIWGDTLAHVGVITHPAHRGRGYGRAVVSGISEFGLRHGLLVQYRTLESNTPSVSIARALGFQQYATTLAVRLRPLSVRSTL